VKAIFDTNVLVSAFIVETGPPRRALESWRASGFELITSQALLTELEAGAGIGLLVGVGEGLLNGTGALCAYLLNRFSISTPLRRSSLT